MEGSEIPKILFIPFSTYTHNWILTNIDSVFMPNGLFMIYNLHFVLLNNNNNIN